MTTGHTPPKDVAEAAQRAVDWIEQGRAGKGFTDTGDHRARQLAARDDVEDYQISKMKQYFARHEPDRSAKGFDHRDADYPSPGRVAWDAWGGDPGRRWVSQQQFDDL